MPNWKKIKAEYIKGGISYRELCKKHSVPFGTLKRIAGKEEWARLREQAEQKANTIIVDKAGRENAERNDVCVSIADKLLKMIEAGIDDGSIAVTAKGLRDITGALKDIRDIKGIKNELDYQEQVARIEKLKREASADASAEPIKVVIAGTAEEFSE